MDRHGPKIELPEDSDKAEIRVDHSEVTHSNAGKPIPPKTEPRAGKNTNTEPMARDGPKIELLDDSEKASQPKMEPKVPTKPNRATMSRVNIQTRDATKPTVLLSTLSHYNTQTNAQEPALKRQMSAIAAFNPKVKEDQPSTSGRVSRRDRSKPIKPSKNAEEEVLYHNGVGFSRKPNPSRQGEQKRMKSQSQRLRCGELSFYHCLPDERSRSKSKPPTTAKSAEKTAFPDERTRSKSKPPTATRTAGKTAEVPNSQNSTDI